MQPEKIQNWLENLPYEARLQCLGPFSLKRPISLSDSSQRGHGILMDIFPLFLEFVKVSKQVVITIRSCGRGVHKFIVYYMKCFFPSVLSLSVIFMP